jgi:putative ABC transport system substrate-binding protein
MERRYFFALVCGATVWPLATYAQQSKKIPRLCFLTFDAGTAESPSRRFEAFFGGLRELGYVNGRTINIDYLHPEGHSDRFPALAADCVRLGADIIAVTTTPAAFAAKNAARTTPIVMVALGDPVGTGLVNSLTQPGGNVTGMSQMTTQLAAKRLELLKEGVPEISRVLVLAYLVDPISPLQVQALKEAAASLGLTLQVIDRPLTFRQRSRLESREASKGSSPRPRASFAPNEHRSRSSLPTTNYRLSTLIQHLRSRTVD